MVNIGGAISSVTGGANLKSIGSGIFSGVSLFLLMLVLAVIIGGIVYVVMMSLKYNKKITLFETIAGRSMPSRKDKAMTVKFGTGGEEILWLRKNKCYRTAYGEQIGKNHYAFAKGSDGYWYNVTFDTIDDGLKRIGLKPTDPNIRFQHSGITKNIDRRFEGVTFRQKYGGLIAYISLIAVTGIMMWLLFDKYLKIAEAAVQAIDAADKVLETTKNVVVANCNMASGGIKPA